jgi:hypothetical protein
MTVPEGEGDDERDAGTAPMVDPRDERDEGGATSGESTAGAAANLFHQCTVAELNATIGIIRQAQMHICPRSDVTAFTSSCFALVRGVDGNWIVESNPQGGQDLYMFTGICVLLAALNASPGLDGNGALSMTASKLQWYVAEAVAEFVPRDARVGVIVVNAIPGEYHDLDDHLDFHPLNPESPGIGNRGVDGNGITQARTLEETITVIKNTVQLVLSVVNRNVVPSETLHVPPETLATWRDGLPPRQLFVDVHSGKVVKALDEEIGQACRWRGKHPCALNASHSVYVRAVLRAVGVELNIRTVFTALTQRLRSEENARRDLASDLDIDQLMASLDTQDVDPGAREDQRKMVREVVTRYARGDSGAVVWAPTGFGKTVIIRDLVRLLGGSFARTIVLTTVQLVEQTENAVGRTSENVHFLTYSKKPGEQMQDAEDFEGTTLVLADECSRVPSFWKEWIKRPSAFRLMFTATPIRSYLEDLIDLAELVMEFPEDVSTVGAARTSLDLVVQGLGFGNNEGTQGEAAFACANFKEFLDSFVVRADPDDITILLTRSIGKNGTGFASLRTVLHVGDEIEKIQKDAKKLNPDLLKKQRTNASYISAIAELAPNAAMARLGPEICNELDLHGLLVSPLEEELFRV